MTDFSILLGELFDNNHPSHIDGDDSLEGRTGGYWTKSDDGEDKGKGAGCVIWDGNRYGGSITMNHVGARPALPFSSSIPTNRVSGTLKRARDGVLEVEYGYYPQKAVSRNMQERLEKDFKSGSLTRTGNKYTTSTSSIYTEVFSPGHHEEFQLGGKRYVRVDVYDKYSGDTKLSNGETYKNGDYVWVEVEPIKWWVSEEDKLMLTEKIIFAGVQFNHETEYHTEDFESTDIKKFIDEYWSEDIEQVRSRRTSSKY